MDAPALVRVRFRRLLEPKTQVLITLPFLAVMVFWGWRTGALLATLPALVITTVLVGACSVDIVCHRLPNRMLLWAAGFACIGALLPIAEDLVLGRLGWESLLPAGRSLLACLGGLIIMVLLSLAPSGMGLGDAKLVGVLGLWLGALSLWAPAIALSLGLLIGGLAAVLFLIARRASRKDLMAFGPYLALGGWLTWLVSAPIG